ncbi:MAG: Neopullulanase [Firmicutes bacterium ADurb.Bin419]|nr:MAG: Neopullulanase [Firmicutes bacterium ADurb.Bin419]
MIYQIFPDRFKRPNAGTNLYSGYYGGNLAGMISEFEYIRNLGVSSIYLNPIFKSGSYHRYDINDYYEVDPILGDKVQLKEFIDLCHASKINVIFDAVLNHTGSEFFAFRDVLAKGFASAYKDWFYIDSFPVSQSSKPNYECFSFFGGMPKLNTSNPKVVEYLVDVLKNWTVEFNIDGWRFDVADEIDREFWRTLRRELKSVKKDIVFVGEIFDEASSWLDGDQFDSVINYPLKSLINDLFAYRSISCTLFKQRISGYLMNFKTGVLSSMVNVISTHDTPRFLTLCKDCEKRFELAVVFQFTFPGVPLVYYGDEIGMKGEADPDCRRPMVWDSSQWNTDLLKLYRFLIAMRKESEALRKGRFVDLNVNGNHSILAYGRQTEKEFLVILMNTSHTKANGSVYLGHIDSDIGYGHDLLQKVTFRIDGCVIKNSLKPYEWRILRLEKGEGK